MNDCYIVIACRHRSSRLLSLTRPGDDFKPSGKGFTSPSATLTMKISQPFSAVVLMTLRPITSPSADHADLWRRTFVLRSRHNLANRRPSRLATTSAVVLVLCYGATMRFALLVGESAKGRLTCPSAPFCGNAAQNGQFEDEPCGDSRASNNVIQILSSAAKARPR